MLRLTVSHKIKLYLFDQKSFHSTFFPFLLPLFCSLLLFPHNSSLFEAAQLALFEPQPACRGSYFFAQFRVLLLQTRVLGAVGHVGQARRDNFSHGLPNNQLVREIPIQIFNSVRVLFENRPALYFFFNYTFISAYKIYFFYSVSKILFRIFYLCYWISLPIMIVKMKIFLHTVYKMIKIFNK